MWADNLTFPQYVISFFLASAVLNSVLLSPSSSPEMRKRPHSLQAKAPSSKPYVLRRLYKAGEIATYNVTIRYSANKDDAVEQMIVKITAKETTDKILGNGRAQLTFQFKQIDVRFGADQLDLSDVIKTIHATCVGELDGSVKDSVITYKTDDEDSLKSTPIPLLNTILQVGSPMLPQRLVRIGDTWTKQMGEQPGYKPVGDDAMSYASMLKALPKLSVRLDGIENIKGAATYRLKFKAVVKPYEEGSDDQAQTSYTYEGTGYVDQKTGRYVRLSCSLASSVTSGERGTFDAALVSTELKPVAPILAKPEVKNVVRKNKPKPRR